MPALALLLGLTGITTVGTAAGTFRATFNNPTATMPQYGPFSLTTWEILAGVGMMALLGPVGAAIGAGLAAGGLVARHDTGQVQGALQALGVTVAQLQEQVQRAQLPGQSQPAQLPGPAPVAPVAPGAPGAPQAAPSFWNAPGQAVRDLWSSLWTPSPTLAPASP